MCGMWYVYFFLQLAPILVIISRISIFILLTYISVYFVSVPKYSIIYILPTCCHDTVDCLVVCLSVCDRVYCTHTHTHTLLENHTTDVHDYK